MIDLHMHSTFSDGSCNIDGLIGLLKEKNITLFSITDHDDIRSCNAVDKAKLKREDGIVHINGVEFSTTFNGNKIHLLGYNFDENAESMRKIIERGREIRRKKTVGIINFLKERFNISLTPTQLEKINSLEVVGKPHIAACLVELGLADSVHDCFPKYFDHYKDPIGKVDTVEAIAAIKKAGGVSCLAHPIEIMKDNDVSAEKVENIVKILKKNGLDAMEVYHSSHSNKMIEDFKILAKKYDLLVSSGSDFHGKVIKTIEIGKCTAENYKYRQSDITITKKFKTAG